MSETDDERAERLLTARIDRNLPKRFYSKVTVADTDGGYEVRLDDRVLKTPLKRDFAVPSRQMADAIAEEWDAQDTHVNPASMIVTRLANTAVDRVAGDEARIIGELVDFAASDLVCYRAGTPASLVERQAAHWDPVLAWAEAAIGQRFVCVEGVMHQAQPDAVIKGVGDTLKTEDAFRLTAVHNMTTLTGSTLIAMMVAGEGLSGDDAWLAAHVDEDWQIEQWGSDSEAEARRAGRKLDFDATVRFLQMC